MSFNGSGVFNRLYNWVNDRDASINITASRMDAEDDGFATGLSNCITKDGQTTVTADLPMATYKHTGVGNGTARDHYCAIGQVQDGSATYAADSGSADAYVAALSPAITAYAAGQVFYVKIGNANTGASTINFNGVGAKNIKKNVDSDLVEGDLKANDIVAFVYDGTNMLLKYNYSSAANADTRNYIVDGGFTRWDEATSQTSSGYGSDTMCFNRNVGSTKTHSRQSFTLGQTDVPGNPEYFSRTVVSSVAGASNLVKKEFRIENVFTLSGGKATLSFDAKADSTKNIAISLYQKMGTGGTPSGDVSGIGAQKISLSTEFQRYSVTIDVPSVSGKTLGLNNDDFLEVNFWFDAGSSFDSRTDSLGQQSGTFDLYGVKLEEGTIATKFEDLHQSVIDTQVNRFFEIVPAGYQGPSVNGTNNAAVGRCTVEKRAAPSVSWLSNINSLNFGTATHSNYYVTATTKSIYPYRAGTATSQDSSYEDLYTVDARL